jgi:signal transduction histidine kinase
VDPRPIQELLAELDLPTPKCAGVLLVDDEFEVLTVLEALLDDDWDVHTAQSGKAALEILQSDIPIQLVITDQRMPEMTGVEFLQAVATSHADLYRMVLTAYSDVDPIVAAINQGKVDQFILKPWDPITIRSLVAEGLSVCERRAAMGSIVATLTARFETQNTQLASLKGATEKDNARAWLSVLDQMGTRTLEDLQAVLTTAQSALPDQIGIQNSARRIRGLVQDLQRISTAQDSSLRVATSPRKLVSDAVRLLLDEDMGQNNAVHVDLEPSVDSLFIDPEPMRQALLNLMRNAIRASEPDTPIQVRVRRGGEGMIVLEVANRGMGMDLDELQQAMTPFFSGFKPPGNGLGLTLCRLVAEVHGGRLALLDNDPSGVLAQLWLPGNPS